MLVILVFYKINVCLSFKNFLLVIHVDAVAEAHVIDTMETFFTAHADPDFMEISVSTLDLAKLIINVIFVITLE